MPYSLKVEARYNSAIQRMRDLDTYRSGPIAWTGKRNRRKLHGRGKGNMMANRYYSVAPSRYCCYGHDHIPYVKGNARQRERVQWLNEWNDEQWSELSEMMAYESWE